jgi:hypothetical protein
MKKHARGLACFLLISSVCFTQTIKVRVVDIRNEHPLANLHVSLSMLYNEVERAPAKYETILRGETTPTGWRSLDCRSLHPHTFPPGSALFRNSIGGVVALQSLKRAMRSGKEFSERNLGFGRKNPSSPSRGCQEKLSFSLAHGRCLNGYWLRS